MSNANRNYRPIEIDGYKLVWSCYNDWEWFFVVKSTGETDSRAQIILDVIELDSWGLRDCVGIPRLDEIPLGLAMEKIKLLLGLGWNPEKRGRTTFAIGRD